MRNYINRGLVQDREVGDKEVEELNCLHYIVDCILERANRELGDDTLRVAEQMAEAFEAIEFVEYEMQKRWGFPLMSRYHTHKKRLERIIGE